MAEKVKQRGGRTRISAKNQVTLPVAVLRDSRLQPGDELTVTTEGDGRVLLSRAVDPLEVLLGSAPGLSARTDLQALRDEWER